MNGDAKDRAAREWFGYGRWSAPYWFVGMEPGGTDDHASYESWLRLGGGELIDCRRHHDDSNAHAPRIVTEWHREINPPTQPTWRRLIQLLFAFEGRSTDLDTIREYQRDHWGNLAGEVALLELSSLHAPNLATEVVGRMSHSDTRIATIVERLDEHHPRFVLFYGSGYREHYERVAGGAFDTEGFRWRGGTLCVLVRHPVGPSAPSAEFWENLGARMRIAVEAGRGSATVAPVAPAAARSPIRATLSMDREADERTTSIPITRAERVVGRVVYNGWDVWVERMDEAGDLKMMGFYERSREQNFDRKVREIDDIFDEWSRVRLGDPMRVKISWRVAAFVPGFSPPTDAIKAGCAVVLDEGQPIAYVYKTPEGAIWESVGELI